MNTTVNHPLHLLPNPLRLNFTFSPQVPISRPVFSEFVTRSMNEYFKGSPFARRLWHDHAEGLISDEEWVSRTLDSLACYINELLAKGEF